VPTFSFLFGIRLIKIGLYVSKTVLALWNAVKDITMPKVCLSCFLQKRSMSSPNYQTSKFDLSSVINHLLFEELGGNCITSFFVTLNPHDDMEDNLSMLNFVDLIRHVVNYPVRNDENFSLLRRKLRKRMMKDHQKQIDLVHSELVQSGKRGKRLQVN
jgi:hypothetical protein